jgi:NAD(P)H dehydrogenase (quinone)
MQDVNVVVVFHSRTGTTERLALTAAVGAVQGRANIRLRRLPDPADEALVDSVPGWKESRARMDMEYVAPRDADAEWADAILVGIADGADLEKDTGALSADAERYFDSLAAFRAQGKLEGKIGASFTRGLPTAALYAAMCRAGLITVPPMPDPDALEAARLQGRRVADMARSLRRKL